MTASAAATAYNRAEPRSSAGNHVADTQTRRIPPKSNIKVIHQERGNKSPCDQACMHAAEHQDVTDISGGEHLLLSSQASHWAAFAGKALISVGVRPAYKVRLPPAPHPSPLYCSPLLPLFNATFVAHIQATSTGAASPYRPSSMQRLLRTYSPHDQV